MSISQNRKGLHVIRVHHSSHTVGFFIGWADSGQPQLHPLESKAKLYSDFTTAQRDAKWVDIMGHHTKLFSSKSKSEILKYE